MEHIARIDIAPDRLAALAVFRQQADPRLVLRIPAIGKALPAHQRFERESDRHVEHDHVLFRNHAVMDRRAVLHCDRLLAADLALGVDHHVADLGQVLGGIADRVQLAGFGIKVGMRGEAAAFQRLTPGIVGDRVELFIDPHRTAAGFNQRPGGAGMAKHVGVDDIERRLVRAGCRRLAQLLADRAGSDPAVAIPQRLAAREPHPVNHAITHEPVIGAGIGRGDRVGTYADIAAIKFGGDRAGHVQIGLRGFGLQGKMNALKVGIGLVRFQPIAVEFGNLHYPLREGITDQGSHCTGHRTSPCLRRTAAPNARL